MACLGPLKASSPVESAPEPSHELMILADTESRKHGAGPSAIIVRLGLVAACPRRNSSVTKEPQEGAALLLDSPNYELGQERVPKLSPATRARPHPHKNKK